MDEMSTNKIEFRMYNPFSQFDSVKEIWTSLLKKCSHSYYLSWEWKELWLDSLPPDCNLLFVTGFIYDTPIVAYFIGSKLTTRNKIFKFNQLALNETMIPHIDLATYIEYNAILIDPEITIPFVQLLDLIPIKSWDEFRMIRCAPIYQPNLILNSNSGEKYNVSIKKLLSYYVDLNKVRQNNNDYLSLISKNQRNLIRRSLKEYEKIGELKILVAGNIKDALIMLDELIELHQKRWMDRGHSGAYSNKFIMGFQRTLISRRFERGEIQMIKVSAGSYTIGCLFSFIHNGRILGYQCGFNYLPGRVYRPGLVCHYFAIIYNAKVGLDYYDFMEGDDEYKQSLSTDYNDVQNIIVQKRDMKYKIDRILVKLSRLFKGPMD
jgi:hypothetical protein